MAPRFTPESLTLDLSVADLLESSFSRSLGFSSRGGYERLWLGQAIHGRYQEQKLEEDPSYRREVVISHLFEHRGWRVTVQGRADGLRREPDGTLVVEEIKSVRSGGALPPAVRESYQRQALLYAWMLSHTEPGPVRAELVLIAIGSNETESEPPRRTDLISSTTSAPSASRRRPSMRPETVIDQPRCAKLAATTTSRR